jgi:hypothetical protein
MSVGPRDKRKPQLMVPRISMTSFFSHEQQQTFHDISFSQSKGLRFKAHAVENVRVEKWVTKGKSKCECTTKFRYREFHADRVLGLERHACAFGST